MSKASDHAYGAIRDLIVSGALAPGSQVTEEDLAQMCGTSRTPVRDAMRRLEADMFIQRTESQRSFVPNWSDDDVADLFALRVRLEGYAAARAAQHIKSSQIDALAKLNAELDESLAANLPNVVDVFLDNNRKFHALFMEAAGSERLKTMLSRIVEPPIVRKTALLYSPDRMQRSRNDHVELVEALKVGDALWAESVMRAHIQKALHTYNEHQRRDAAGAALD